MPGKSSKANKLSDRRRARAAAYAHNQNPFAEGSRLWKYYNKARHQVEVMRAIEREMSSVYGAISQQPQKEFC